jgi:multimeric flavodoxin WrbA
MNIIGIACSPRKDGNTDILIKEALTGAKDSGAKTELITIRDNEIKPCDGCGSCANTGVCHIKDDMQIIYKKMLDADGIILATPVYFWTVSGQAKVLIDRTYALRCPKLMLANKVGGAIAVAARTGVVNTLNLFQRYFASNHMFTADLVGGLAEHKKSIINDERGMKSAYEMGRQIVSLIRQKFRFPDEFDIPLYTFVEKKYKTSSYPKP